MRKAERLSEKTRERIRKLYATLPRSKDGRVRKVEATLLAKDFGIGTHYLHQIVRDADST
jgi:hypothetical protein